MMSKIITAVGIDVSKGKSVVAVRRPGGEVMQSNECKNNLYARRSQIFPYLLGTKSFRIQDIFSLTLPQQPRKLKTGGG